MRAAFYQHVQGMSFRIESLLASNSRTQLWVYLGDKKL